MKNKIYLFGRTLLALSFLIINTHSQGQKISDSIKYAPIDTAPFYSSTHHWYDIYDNSNIINPRPGRPKYRVDEITRIADNILIYQRNNGGWPKNYDMLAILSDAQKDSLITTKNILNTTIDNTTTYSQIEYLARVFTVTHIDKYKKGSERGIEYLLSAQYTNGGWPQYFPLEDDYSRRITFNDGAYIGVMGVLKDILDNKPYYSFVDVGLREKVKIAYDQGMDCILKCQIRENGKTTVWGQQHNEVDLKPDWARAFEPPSICNGESSAVVLFLMGIDNPSKEIISAIQNAVKWFDDSKIFGIIVNTVPAPEYTSKWKTTNFDRVVVNDPTAPPIWTRYYELGTHRPLFCDRNSKYLYSLAEVDRERRSGYGWYTYLPQEVLDKYPAWQKKWAPGQNVLKK
jgi:PelA/Pel-15E family pectate lyase